MRCLCRSMYIHSDEILHRRSLDKSVAEYRYITATTSSLCNAETDLQQYTTNTDSRRMDEQVDEGDERRRAVNIGVSFAVAIYVMCCLSMVDAVMLLVVLCVR